MWHALPPLDRWLSHSLIGKITSTTFTSGGSNAGKRCNQQKWGKSAPLRPLEFTKVGHSGSSPVHRVFFDKVNAWQSGWREFRRAEETPDSVCQYFIIKHCHQTLLASSHPKQRCVTWLIFLEVLWLRGRYLSDQETSLTERASQLGAGRISEPR